MIFVTVGIGIYYGFPRLIKEMDRIAGETEEKVVMQIGYTGYLPQNAEYFRFASKKEIEKFYESTRVVVCHDGAGSIITALQHFKPVIAVPRMRKYGEVAYDNKGHVAKELAKDGIVVVVEDIRELESALRNISTRVVSFRSKTRLASRLKEYLDQL